MPPSQISFRLSLAALLLLIFIGMGSNATPGTSSPPRGTAADGPSAEGLENLKEEPPSPGPDSRYKAGILVVVAHPDDETAIGGYLARAIYDEHKRVAALFGTRGNAGGNAMGYEQAAALGAEREIEARRALASMGVMNVWFIGGPDTPGQDVLRSLETWNHGASLEEAVRIVRLTRPEVILTWLPHYVVGENHGDHQASAVIATEAFDVAGDPAKFAEQLAFPRNRHAVGNLTEGLRPWQPEKLYYFSDATETAFMNGQGPVYSVTDVSPSRHLPYYRLAAMEASYHLTQGDSGQMAKTALETGNFTDFEAPIQFIFGKSLVRSSVRGDIFEGVVPGAIPFAPVRGYEPQTQTGLSVELGGPWAFYRQFWAAHNIEHLASLMRVPEIGINAGGTLHVPLLLRNPTSHPAAVDLKVEIPAGWTEEAGSGRYPVGAHDAYPAEAVLTAPPGRGGEWQQITWNAESEGQRIGSVTVKVFLTAQPGLPP